VETGDQALILFTLTTALAAIVISLPPGIALAWLLARRSWPGKNLAETLVLFPLVFPPVATGWILLLLLGRHGPLGKILGEGIVFTPAAVVAAMAVMSFPLLVRGARQALEGVDPRLEQVASTLGVPGWRVFMTITLPLASRGILGAASLSFARALGEFGATIMVAGYIPGVTATISTTFYNDIQLGRDTHAWRLMLVSCLLALLFVSAAGALSRSPRKP
jgi:molybdate transport system permease protein